MPKTIKVGVVTHAQGAHLEAYFTALAQTEEAAEVVLADPSGQTVQRAEKGLKDKLTKVYPDTDTMLRQEKPQLALVSMEAAQAPPAIDAALEAGCHVFAEKPACVRVADFEKLARKAEMKHRYLMLALANRVHAPVQEARRLIQEGKLGNIHAANIFLVADQTRLRRPDYQKSWFASKERAGGGHLIWLGIHWLDLAMYLTGLSVAEVAAFTANVGGQPVDIEDSAAVALRFDSGIVGTMLSGYYLDKGYHSHLQIWGEHGWLKLQATEDLPLEWYSAKDNPNPQVQRFAYPKGQRGYTPFVRAAVRACAGLQETPITTADSLRVLRTIFAAYDAARTGQARKV
ncbi:MAG: Gfo/Idh/MocA family protein [Gemmataceae bacterium]